MLRHLLTASLLLFTAPLFAADEKTWEGTWTNARFKTSGPLKCVATQGEDGTWEATFSGSFQGQAFKYDVEFQSKKGSGGLNLSGTSKIDGFEYEWTGTLKGTTLSGRYRASNGYNGGFTLREPKKN